MAKRAFVNNAQKLYSYAGRMFRGEGVLSVTKAMLDLGESYYVLALMPRPIEQRFCHGRVKGDSKTDEPGVRNDDTVIKGFPCSVNPMAHHALG